MFIRPFARLEVYQSRYFTRSVFVYFRLTGMVSQTNHCFEREHKRASVRASNLKTTLLMSESMNCPQKETN